MVPFSFFHYKTNFCNCVEILEDYTRDPSFTPFPLHAPSCLQSHMLSYLSESILAVMRSVFSCQHLLAWDILGCHIVFFIVFLEIPILDVSVVSNFFTTLDKDAVIILV